ncbi:MAG: SH3 domain-containing protein, partial [Clostridia bacterium]|nr:SH3 domain-containing protein [Clostridia bacterium]
EYVTEYDPSSAEAVLPEGTAAIPQYMTLYLDADTSGMVYWSSSDTSVATVDSGSGSQVFVYGAAPGTAEIIAKNASGTVLAKKTVEVTAPEAVRFAYTTPNIITAGESFDFVAITDSGKTAVKFEVEGVGTYETSSYTAESYGENTVSVFKCNTSIAETGTYKVRAYSSTGGDYSTSCHEFDIVVVSSTDPSVTTTEERRISDTMLHAVALYEGYRPEVYADTLAGNIPTVGYGFVVNENTTFYNGLTETEAMVMLADTLNRRGYTTQLNKFIQDNGIRMNQNQFDAFVSFSYNIGSGYWNTNSKFYIRTILKDNTYSMPDTLSAEQPLSGQVSNTDGIKIYDGQSGSAAVLKSLALGDKVTIAEYYRNADTTEAWYKVTAGGVSGWVRTGDIILLSTQGLVRDLAYVDGYTLCSNLLEWHRAGGRCINGLYYRRLAEAKVFSHGNYAEATKGHAQYKSNTYGYAVPTCIK